MDQISSEITEQLEVSSFESIESLVAKALRPKEPQGKKQVTPCFGFKNLDKITGGLVKGRLITLAARPSTGKTAFLLSVITNIAIKQNFQVALFSAERTGPSFAKRLIEGETGTSLENIKKSSLKYSELDKLETLVNNISKAGILVDDKPTITVAEIVSKTKILKERKQVDVVMIDYLELLASNETKLHPDDSLAKAVFDLKKLAQDLDLPILLFSQMQTGRGFMDKPTINETPVALSEISDTMMFLHRNYMVNGLNGQEAKNARIIVSKSPGLEKEVELPVSFIETTGKFVDF